MIFVETKPKQPYIWQRLTNAQPLWTQASIGRLQPNALANNLVDPFS